MTVIGRSPSVSVTSVGHAVDPPAPQLLVLVEQAARDAQPLEVGADDLAAPDALLGDQARPARGSRRASAPPRSSSGSGSASSATPSSPSIARRTMSRRVASARAPNMRSKSGGAICIDTTIRLYVGRCQERRTTTSKAAADRSSSRFRSESAASRRRALRRLTGLSGPDRRFVRGRGRGWPARPAAFGEASPRRQTLRPAGLQQPHRTGEPLEPQLPQLHEASRPGAGPTRPRAG